MKSHQKKSHSRSKKKDINKYGYDVSKFRVFDMPVRRDPNTGRLISTDKPSQKSPTKNI